VASLLLNYRPPSFDALSVVSLRNYWEVFSRPHFISVVGNTLILMAIAATATMLLAFFVLWIVVRTQLRGRALLDKLFFYPTRSPALSLRW
jgi:iron(III) transport system permease protein